MDSEQRRKKKRTTFTYKSSKLNNYLSAKYIFLCLSFLLLLFFIYTESFKFNYIPTVSIRPVLNVSNLSLFSLQKNPSFKLRQSSPSSSTAMVLRVEDRVLFPDQVLLFVPLNTINQDENLDCVYYKLLLAGNQEVVKQSALSIDEYDEFGLIVRCPLPPVNYSASVDLMRHGDSKEGHFGISAVHSWEKLVYAATLDGNDTVVVFAKGLNLRPHRESDASYYKCRFRLRNLGEKKDESFWLTTKAITAAQEIVRCLLPRSIRQNPEKARGIRVTLVHTIPRYYRRAPIKHEILPSVARISVPISKSEKKYELCACTMLWNQASSLKEWITYHTWLGVERWFIYDNNSDDGIRDSVDELDFQDFNVTRHTWPWIKTQEAGFSHCALRARDECTWVGFFDVDEFFYFPRDHRQGFSGQNSLKSLVANYSSSRTIAEIRTSCHSFGPSGLSSHPTQGVTVGYTCRVASPERHKSIIRPDLLDPTLLNVVHHFLVKPGYTYWNMLESNVIINHYKYQVWETFRTKFFRRVATYVVDWQEDQNKGSKDRAPGLGTEAIEPGDWKRQFCEVWDTGLRDYVLANFADPATGLLPWEINLNT
ncbi:hypothetical protein ACFE04_022530 [Oxalis oulophora]